MKKLLFGLTFVASMSLYAAEFSSLKGCVISLPEAQSVRTSPTAGLFSQSGKDVFVAQQEDKFYIESVGKSYYGIEFSVAYYLKVISTDDITKKGYLTYTADSYSDGAIDVQVDKCGAKYGLIETR